MRAVNEGSARVIQENYFDNANSLPLGEGEQLTRTFDGRPGAYRKIGTDVTAETRSVNNIITRK